MIYDPLCVIMPHNNTMNVLVLVPLLVAYMYINNKPKLLRYVCSLAILPDNNKWAVLGRQSQNKKIDYSNEKKSKFRKEELGY